MVREGGEDNDDEADNAAADDVADDDVADDDGDDGGDGVDRQLVRMGYRFLVRGCKFS